MSSPRSPRRSTESFEFLTPNTSQYPFPPPQNEWATRPSSTGGRYQPRRGSTASSIHSVGGVLDAGFKTNMGAVREQHQNAISTLLQPPIVRTGMLPHTTATAASGHRPPSTRDIPPVTLANIPHIEPTAFNPYLAQIGNLYDAFQRAKAEAQAESAPPVRQDSKKSERAESRDRGLHTGSPAVTPNLSGTPSTPNASPKAKKRTSGSKRPPPAATPLSTIPHVYFDENFHLENPRTFDIVSERSEVVRPVRTQGAVDADVANGSLDAPIPTGRKALATNAILQEKLSWYMDTVEVHLISAISTASKSFFAALGSLRELESDASESVTKIKEIREDLKRLDEQMAVGGLKVVELKRRRENLRKLTDAVDQLQAVMVGLSHCDEVVSKGELEVAMSRLDMVEILITGALDTTDSASTSWLDARLPPNLIDLRNLRALDGVFEGIHQLKFRVGTGFEARFIQTLLTDLRDHVKNVPNHDTLERWVRASQKTRGTHQKTRSLLPAYMTTSENFRSDLRTSLYGLSGAHFTNQASATFRDLIVKEMKLIIRKYLPSSTDDDTASMTSVSTRDSRGHSQQDKNSILARNLRAMDPADAEDFFANIFTDTGEALRRLSIQVKVLLDVTSGVTTPPLSAGGLRSPPRSPFMIGNIDDYMSKGNSTSSGSDLQMEWMQALDMSSLLGQAVDAAQTQITKLLKVRSEPTTSLPLERFLRYFKLCRLFADECEAVSGRSGAALKGVVNNHITDFVSKYGDIEKQELAKAMDSDRWEPKDFEAEDTEVLARILQGMESDPPNWAQSGDILREIKEPVVNGNSEQTNGTSEDKPKEKGKTTVPAIVDEEKYTVSSSSTYVIRGIERFEILLSAIPSMTSEVSSSLCEYIKLFNSRLCQLILGAGAMHSAGLKNINTKHLAIASQTLSFIIAILPYIRECARRRSTATTKSAIAEFDNTKRLLQDQQVSIHDKLTDILSGRATVHMRSLKKVDWDSEAEANKAVSPSMESLTKDTVTMHKVINKYLSEMQVRMIMAPVFESYREQVGKVITEAAVATPRGKARLLREAKLFDAKLGPIDGAGNVGAYLIQLVEGRTVAQPQPQPQPQSESAPPTNEKTEENTSANGGTA
ncbi:Vps54-domain-containing protein [Dothidotthia symphoricarpi CBS 119687]|uniref:Vacuolar protein sorting-associated protein 54 n=1 Tax=Dothidotthia symphoricarpi CBS 119687 TaxID=1392245 RepID=A0A6A6A368_9PLEO|nr:Vps54-domain-containing protein [Dothidotthia symphoricarpi CBS 119687]KAF2125564.1 Vps54-domain-containing protein [Dothidotthia symphoricarpi CBS 119687]